MSNFSHQKRAAAVSEFRRARRHADLTSLLSKLTGKQDELLSFEEIKGKLNLANPRKQYLANIPLDSIVGSVGRYFDFNRQFYPLSDGDESRWAGVKQMVEGMGLPPIEVYKVGEAYFVLDGHHRVSVARQVEATHIEAYVNEFRSKITLSPEDSIEDVILKAEHEELNRMTMLDQVCPDLEFRVTIPGRFKEIYEHISVHRYYLGIEQGHEITLEEATASWVENVCLPVIRAIRESNILEDFPHRTETDLYLWLKKHQWELQKTLGSEVELEEAAQDMTEKFSHRPGRIIGRFFDGLIDWFKNKFL